LDSEAQQFMANEACGAMKICKEDLVRPSKPNLRVRMDRVF
jgi:hypothetical protein